MRGWIGDASAAVRATPWPFPRRFSIRSYAAGAVAALAAGGLAGLAPATAVALLAGAALAGAVLVSLPVGACVFVVVAHLEALPRLAGAVSLAKVTGLLLVASWLVAMLVRPGERARLTARGPLQAALLAWFLVWLSATLLWAGDLRAGFADLPRYALNLALFPIIAAAMRERRHVVAFVAAMVIGAFISAAYGLVFRVEATNEARLGGAGLNANLLGSVLIFGTILSATLALNRSLTAGVRLLAAFSCAFCAYSLLMTLSRGALIGTTVALVTAVVIAGRRRRAKLALGAVVAAACVVVYFAAFAPAAARERVTNAGDGSGRVDIWAVGWRMFEDRPFQGVGVGNFRTSTVDYLLQPGVIRRSEIIVDDQKVAHNIYLQLLAETGVLGLALFAGIIAFALSCGLLAARTFERRGDRSMSALTRGVLVGLAGVLAASFFSSAIFLKPLWLILALCPALLTLAQRQGSGPPAIRAVHAAGRDPHRLRSAG
jgi:putative inorganic carbon (HCO3(-)) transporter